MFKKGDIVGRISYNKDIIFVIKEIKGNIAYLKGKYIRLVADSDINDLSYIDDNILNRFEEINNEYEKNIISSYINKTEHITGKILHFDSDPFYLKRCLNLYKSLGLYSIGVELEEKSMPEYISSYLEKYHPDVIIITGHDSYNNKGLEDLRNYRNTINFIKTVKIIRDKFKLDDVFIFAGACGSNAEALLASGANFASSLDRKNIEAYDPAIVGIMASITPFNKIIKIEDIYNHSKMNRGSICGVESYGKMRLLLS